MSCAAPPLAHPLSFHPHSGVLEYPYIPPP